MDEKKEKKFKITRKELIHLIISVIITVACVGLIYILILPAHTIKAVDVQWYLVFIFLMLCLLLMDIRGMDIKLPLSNILNTTHAIVLLAFVTISVITLQLISLPIFNATKYKDRIGEINTLEKPLNNLTDISTIRTVDEATAINLASKKLGEISGLGSYCEVNEAYIQVYNDELVWVLPTNHKSLVKYLTHKDGTPAYVIVSATDSSDVRFVNELDGEAFNIRYRKGGYLTSVNIRRYLYNNGVKDIYEDASFELDEKGTPYWVVSYIEPQILISSPEPVKIVLCNAITGEFKEYAMNDVPEWVDRIYTEELVINQLDDNGKYTHGFMNSIFGKQDVTETNADTTNFVRAEDGNTYWSTSISSNGADESAIGYMLVDTRTKETFYYKQAGTTEDGAMKSAEGKVQEKGYVASYPTLYTINDVPTYVMALKDTSGLVKAYAFVSLVDVNTVTVEDTVQRAYNNYFKLLNESGKIPEVNLDEVATFKAVINDIKPVVIEGQTYYYIKLNNKPQVFKANVTVSNELPFLKIGDTIEVGTNDSLNIIKLEVSIVE